MEQRNYLRIWTLDVYIFISIFLIKNQMMLSASALEQADNIYRCASLFVFLFIVQQGATEVSYSFTSLPPRPCMSLTQHCALWWQSVELQKIVFINNNNTTDIMKQVIDELFSLTFEMSS